MYFTVTVGEGGCIVLEVTQKFVQRTSMWTSLNNNFVILCYVFVIIII